MKNITANEIELTKKGKTVVDFYADWCGPCQYMKPFFEEAEKEINALGAECFEVNVDECEEFALKNKINFIPCVIVFDNGVEKARFTGGKDTEGILQFVRENVNK